MEIKIDNRQTKVTLSFTPSKYILVYGYDGTGGGDKKWTLNLRIDRSFKGKDDDIGMAIVHLYEKEVEIFKQAGFSFCELGGLTK